MKSIKAFAATLVTGAGITAALLGAGPASADSSFGFGDPNTVSPNLIDEHGQHGAPGWLGPGQAQLMAHGHLNLRHQLNPQPHDAVGHHFRGRLRVLR